MATFQGKVTQEGWSIEVQTDDTFIDSQGGETNVVERLARSFIEAQTSLQAEGQRFIRQTFERETIPPQTNGVTPYEEAEDIHDSKTYPLDTLP